MITDRQKKKEFLEKHKDFILAYDFRILKKDKKFATEGFELYKTDEVFAAAIRTYRKKVHKPVAEFTLTPDTIKTRIKKKKRVTKKTIDVAKILDDPNKYEETILETTEEKETKKIDSITFHSDFSKDLYPVVTKLISDSKEYLKNIQKTHLKDAQTTDKYIKESIETWKKRVEPLELLYNYYTNVVKNAVKSGYEGEDIADNIKTMSAIDKFIDPLIKLVDKISNIENNLLVKMNAKYDIRGRQAKEIVSFVDSLVKMQMTIKGIVDNDVNLLSNNYVQQVEDNNLNNIKKDQDGTPVRYIEPSEMQEVDKHIDEVINSDKVIGNSE